MSRICARTGSNPREVSTTKSARLRFSASGICRARMASAFSCVGPRAPARAHAARSGWRGHEPRPRRPAFRRRFRYSRGTSTHHDRRTRLLCIVQEFSRSAPQHADARSARASSCAAGFAPPAATSFARSTLPFDGGSGKRGLDRRYRCALIDRVHGGIGVINRNACFREQLHRGGFPIPIEPVRPIRASFPSYESDRDYLFAPQETQPAATASSPRMVK